jgi:membrane protease YdiL (CAAX protease family)
MYIVPGVSIDALTLRRLRRSPGLLGTAYLGVCLGLPYAIPSPWTANDLPSRAANRTAGAVALCIVSWMFSTLYDGDRARPQTRDLSSNLRKFAQGVGFGIGAFASMVVVAYGFGWVSFVGWGSHHASRKELGTSMSLLALYHLAAATSEELVFRGYSLKMLRQALGLPAAMIILVTLSTLAHARTPHRALGMSAAALEYTMLRLASGSLWTTIGCHFAWNYAQTGLLGPTDGPPSLLPMHNQGPRLWLGRPGYPEPGLLPTIASLSIAAAAAALWWRARRK